MAYTKSTPRLLNQMSKPERRGFDWILAPPENVTPFQQFILDIDWKSSPLGLMKYWPSQLRQMVLLVVQDPSPAIVYWGDDSTIIYNEAYAHLIGSKHPALQGQDPKIEFAEIWNHLEALLKRQRETAETVVEANSLLLLNRYGFSEEAYFSWKFVPIIGDGGWVVGSYATAIEVTREVISDRRLHTVHNLGRQIYRAESIKDLWARVLRGIEDAEKDIPLALVYSLADTTTGSRIPTNIPPVSQSPQSIALSEAPPSAISTICILEGYIGIPKGHPSAPETVIFESDDKSYLKSALRQALQELMPVLVPLAQEAKNELSGINCRGHGVPPTQLVVCPIIPTDSLRALGFLVVALNPLRPYDDDYRGFLRLLIQQVTQPQLSAVIVKEKEEQRQQLAKKESLNRARLSSELSESETKFARFSSCAPIGLAILTTDFNILSANSLWCDLTGLRVGSSSIEWPSMLADGEVELVTEAWKQLTAGHKPITLQTRLRRPWRAPDLDHEGKEQWCENHILLAMYPDMDENGDILSVMGCITDINGLKWSESRLRRKMDQVIEMEKKQERFIDMISHEMRNPLSALIGCADEIISSLTEYRSVFKSEASSPTLTPTAVINTDSSLSQRIPPLATYLQLDPRYLINEAVEAAETIIYCAMHQKRVIDDVLTLSRLDSCLLLITPSPTRPLPLIRSALKMFDAELKCSHTELNYVEDESIKRMRVDRDMLMLDPSRILQVLINLMTNAIKFTRTEEKREICVRMAASFIPPIENTEGINYVEWGTNSTDQTTKPEWGNGEVVYLSITVTDTGQGLSSNEMKNLFHLFAQASPKTHQTYGGSELALYISSQLVHMQGGKIGVQSTQGQGSTFTYYVKTRRTTAAQETGSVSNMDSIHSYDTEAKNYELLARADALREACGVDASVLHNGNMTVNMQISQSKLVHRPYNMNVSREQLHILVVEDNLVNQKVVTKSLRKSGHIVSVANHGEEALEFLRRSELWVHQNSNPQIYENGNVHENKPVINEYFSSHEALNEVGLNAENATTATAEAEKLNVILMDLEMPVMDGLTCVRRIRELQSEGRLKRHVPVIAVTANARKDQIFRSFEAGMDDVTTKPYRITDMLMQIEKVVARCTLTEES